MIVVIIWSKLCQTYISFITAEQPDIFLHHYFPTDFLIWYTSPSSRRLKVNRTISNSLFDWKWGKPIDRNVIAIFVFSECKWEWRWDTMSYMELNPICAILTAMYFLREQTNSSHYLWTFIFLLFPSELYHKYTNTN